jgi:hypothetical protein
MSKLTSKLECSVQGMSKKAVVAQFNQPHASSDGGALLLKVCVERLGLSGALAQVPRVLSGAILSQCTPLRVAVWGGGGPHSPNVTCDGLWRSCLYASYLMTKFD